MVTQTLTNADIQEAKWESQYGISFSIGRTFYLHKKPLFKMVKIGLDLILPSVTYVKYSTPSNMYYEDESGDGIIDLDLQQVDFGASFGPSITVNPIDHLKISTYFYYSPSASVIMLKDEVNTEFVSFLTVGGSISYKAISFGVDWRWGSANYKSFSINEDVPFDDEDIDFDDVFSSGKNKLKTASTKVYLSIRF